MRDRGPCWPRGTALPRASGPLCTPLLLEARIEGSRCPELVLAPAPQAGGRVGYRQLSNELSLPSIGSAAPAAPSAALRIWPLNTVCRAVQAAC